MRLIRRLIPLIAAALPASAGAEILDIQAEQAGSDVRILFVFDTQPADASITVSGTEAQATIAAAHGAGRLLRPDASGLRQISVADRPLGLSIGAVAERPILAAEAEVFRNAVMFRLTLATEPAAAPDTTWLTDAAPPEAPAAEAPDAGAPAPVQPPAETPPAPEDAAADAAALAAMLEAAAADAEAALAEAAPAQSEQTEQARDPQWAEGDALSDRSAPLSPSRPGAAAELFAAQLDATACAAAAATVSADPWALDALHNHGACLARDGHTARAQEVFDRLAAFDPASARTLVALGVLRQDAGDRAAAQDYYDRAMAVAPDDGLAVLVRMLRDL